MGPVWGGGDSSFAGRDHRGHVFPVTWHQAGLMPPGRSWPAAAGSDPWLPGVSPSRGPSPCCSELGSLGCSPSPSAHSTAPFGHTCLFSWLDPPSLAHSPPPPRGPPRCFQAVGHVTPCLSVCSPSSSPTPPSTPPGPVPCALLLFGSPFLFSWVQESGGSGSGLRARVACIRISTGPVQ